ncbi:MAG: nuclear transport factor 2 family protein [Chitinophagaceae bacterium]|nr:MAG: nuclear transport factor 2 family protein [Chitinophagaceae bacterium]
MERLNGQIRSAYLNSDAAVLSKLYADSFILMPEYKPAIGSREALFSFYTDWFSSVKNTTFKKQVDKAEPYGDYLLETGTFQLQYDSGRVAARSYAGNYMIMWKRDKMGRLKIHG